eukprot:NODE_5328_length_1782_cov_16.447734.p1 GENE.NODE_5328_length_1782_cov_16.447734~~NODE_5328_length_1782_cov_16.447734.p1  ORF type:complete len:475 (-),score=54.79 NODE_5328_length_1782_cov_16.447734:296-1720(-)
MTSAMIEKAKDESAVEQDNSIVKVDLKIASTKELREVMARLQKRIDERSILNVDLVTLQFKHIKAELDMNSVLPLSLEHIDLFQQYLDRFVLEALPEPLIADRRKLLSAINALVKAHPRVKEVRSGDRVGVAGGFAILKVPAHRRMQMMAILYGNFLTGPVLVFTILFLLWWLVPFSTYLFLLYAACVVYDNLTRPMPAPKRVVQKWRHSIFYKLFRDYFPIRTVLANQPAWSDEKTTSFDPSRNYLFCYHPHGVQGAGALGFASAALGFDELFPGLTCSVQTLPMNFKCPIMRENIIALGMGDASKPCLLRALSMASGSCAMLITGGAKESMHAHPGHSKVVLKSRLGFVKIALLTGASLVPVWGFGENNLYENLAVKSPALTRWQHRVQKRIAFAPLLVKGRGIFSYGGGLIPHRRPITAVVGEPVHTGRPDPNPSNDRIEEVHEQYKESVATLFSGLKDIYDPRADPLEFL